MIDVLFAFCGHHRSPVWRSHENRPFHTLRCLQVFYLLPVALKHSNYLLPSCLMRHMGFRSTSFSSSLRCYIPFLPFGHVRVAHSNFTIFAKGRRDMFSSLKLHVFRFIYIQVVFMVRLSISLFSIFLTTWFLNQTKRGCRECFCIPTLLLKHVMTFITCAHRRGSRLH